MEIKVKYNNGKLFSNNKDIILNNLADIYEITQNEPCALSTKVFFGIIKDVDGKKRIFLIAPVRSLVDEDVIYLYVFGKQYPRRWLRLDKFTETRTIFDSYIECVDFYKKTENGASVYEKPIKPSMMNFSMRLTKRAVRNLAVRTSTKWSSASRKLRSVEN